MKTIVIATKNRKKKAEIERLLAIDARFKILSDFKDIPDVHEDGLSFDENAIKKAIAVSKRTGHTVLADDSGLEIGILGKRPGVFSSRFAGEEKNDRLNNLKVLFLLKDLPREKRNARFCCSVAIAKDSKLLGLTKGACEGTIAFKRRGSFGFGYDPLFIPKGYNKTFAELGSKIKDRLSHRSKALRKARRFILKAG